MLQFIVLGQIPGTGFQLTFTWLLLLAPIALMALELHLHKKHKQQGSVNYDVIRPGDLA